MTAETRSWTLSRRVFLKALGILGAAGAATGLGVPSWAAEWSPSRYVQARANALYQNDRAMPIRMSQDNPEIKAIYRDFLVEPLSPTSESLLHTTYTPR